MLTVNKLANEEFGMAQFEFSTTCFPIHDYLILHWSYLSNHIQPMSLHENQCGANNQAKYFSRHVYE